IEMLFFRLWMWFKEIYYFFFFFQAEDGIRDFHVTGVQTCALPIYFPGLISSWPAQIASWLPSRSCLMEVRTKMPSAAISTGSARSEERRVGKECRSRWSQDD